jgi:exodeoxyribonuclease III
MFAMPTPLTVATWNVNSLRARLALVTRWVKDKKPDVICLQETKVTDDEFPLDDFTILGYHEALHGQKSYNGVAILSRKPLADVSRGFDGKGAEEQKRLIAATIAGIRVVNAYIPNGGEVGSDKFAYKLDFLDKLRGYFAELKPTDPVVFVGDFNVATEPRDVYDPKALEGTTCYHPDERAALAKVAAWGFVDLFRRYESGAGLYSWWDYRTFAWQKNLGLRIDHIWTTETLAARSTACRIEKDERAKDKASDHAPVVATFTV